MSARTGTWWFRNQADRKKPDPSGSGHACRKTCGAPMRPTFSTPSFTLFTKTAGSGSYTASRSTCAARPGRRGGPRPIVPQLLPEGATRLPEGLLYSRPVLLPVLVSCLLEEVPPRGDGWIGVPVGVGRNVPVKVVAVGRDLHQAASVRFPDLLPRHQRSQVLWRIVEERGDDRQRRPHVLLPQEGEHLLGKAPVRVIER